MDKHFFWVPVLRLSEACVLVDGEGVQVGMIRFQEGSYVWHVGMVKDASGFHPSEDQAREDAINALLQLEEKEFRAYGPLFGDRVYLCNVQAVDEMEAEIKVKVKLDVPGMRDAYFAWIEGGKELISE